MTRIRTIKPELFRHEGLFEAELIHKLPLRLAFIGLFTCCDREGRFRWKPRQLKLDIFPYDDVDFSQVLNALLAERFIQKYASDGNEYGCIPSWHRHQVINHKEKKSSIPEHSGTLTDEIRQVIQSFDSRNNELSDEKSTNIDCKISENLVADLIPNNLDFINDKSNGNCNITNLNNEIYMISGQKSRENNASATCVPHVTHACTTRRTDRIPVPNNARGEKELEREGNMEREKEQGSKLTQGCDVVKVDHNEKIPGKRGSAHSFSTLMKSSSQPESVPQAKIQRIFEFWCQTMGQPYARLDKNRRIIIQNALKLGYSQGELFNAIVGCAHTPYNMGQNDRGELFNGLHVIFRDSSQIERFIRHFHSPPTNSENSTKMAQSMVVIKSWLKKKTIS